jgi:hypothetical protein
MEIPATGIFTGNFADIRNILILRLLVCAGWQNYLQAGNPECENLYGN